MLGASVNNFIQSIRSKLSLPINRSGEVLSRGLGVWDTVPTVSIIALAHNDVEVDEQKGITESFANVFNNWQRFSRLSNQPGVDDAIPSELDQWTYDAANNRVICTVNSTSLVGFISPYKYDQYVFEAALSSTNSDDNHIGLCIAHARDPQTGDTHILTAIRSLTGNAPLSIIKNPGNQSLGGTVIELVRNGLQWGDGTEAVGPIANSAKPGWSTLGGSILLKVERNGDIVTISTSQLTSGTYFEPATTVIDLSADPELEVFRGPQRYGYVCSSQQNSTWETLQRPGSAVPVVDTRDWTHWKFESGGWVAYPDTYSGVVDEYKADKSGVVVNPHTGVFYIPGSTNFTAV